MFDIFTDILKAINAEADDKIVEEVKEDEPIGVIEEKIYYDYLQRKIWSYSEFWYQKCEACGFYVFKSSTALELCPKCVLQLPQTEIEISFGKSSSKKYKQVVRLSKSINGYIEEEVNGKLLHIIKFCNIDEYLMENAENKVLDKLIMLAFQWVSFKITLNGNKIILEALRAIRHEAERNLRLARL